MKNKQELICILCPNGCNLEVEEIINKNGNKEFKITGNKCKRAAKYVEEELTCPKRTLTTTVKTSFKQQPRISVRTDGDIELKKIFTYMKEINKIIVKDKLKVGDIIIPNLLDSGVNLIATTNIELGTNDE